MFGDHGSGQAAQPAPSVLLYSHLLIRGCYFSSYTLSASQGTRASGHTAVITSPGRVSGPSVRVRALTRSNRVLIHQPMCRCFPRTCFTFNNQRKDHEHLNLFPLFFFFKKVSASLREKSHTLWWFSKHTVMLHVLLPTRVFFLFCFGFGFSAWALFLHSESQKAIFPPG